MLVFLIIFYFVWFLTLQSMHANQADLFMPVHQACLQLAPSGPRHALYEAVICGTSASHDAIYFSLERTGLLFILASPGFHLVVLEWILISKCKYRMITWTVFLASMLVVAAATNGSAPIMRAIFSYMISRAVQKFRLGWRRTQITTASGIASLGFCKTQGQFAGLILCWVACLALSSFSDFSKKPTPRWLHSFLNQLKIYVLLIPVLIPMSVPHPITVFYGALAFPFVNLILFLNSILGFVVPPLRFLSDAIWNLFSSGVQRLALITPAGSRQVSLPLWILVAYLGSITIIAWRIECSRSRSQL